MKILYFIADFPVQLDKGHRVAIANLLEDMSKKHDCHIIAFTEADNECNDCSSAWKTETRSCQLFTVKSGVRLQFSRLRNLLLRKPLFLAKWENEDLLCAIRERMEQTDFDLVHLEGLALAQYLTLFIDKPTVLSTTDAVSLAYKRKANVETNIARKAYLRYASRIIKLYESSILDKATKVHIVSNEDAQYLRCRIPSLNVNNIELSLPKDLIQYDIKRNKGLGAAQVILLLGQLNNPSIERGMVWFLDLIYPAVAKKHGNIHVKIIGQNASKRFRNRVNKYEGVEYIPWVSDYYGSIVGSSVVVFPDLAGTGIKNRVIQAMALMKPVVGTPVAFQGIPVEEGKHCFVSEDAQGFIDAIDSLLCDKHLSRLVGEAARELIMKIFTIDVVGNKWDILYREVLEEYWKAT